MAGVADRKERRLAAAMLESCKIISSLMKAYESGDTAMYIPMAAQLRILFCDTQRKKDNSVLGRLLPKLKLRAFRSIEFQNAGGPLQFAAFPFEISVTNAGVVLADFDLSYPPTLICLSEWREQVITYIPCRLTVAQIIRSVCDKGGGAHVDDNDGAELAAMR